MGTKAWMGPMAASLLMLGCTGSREPGPIHVVTARDLAGTYTGVLEGVRVPSLEALKDTSQHVVLSVDLTHRVSATAKSDVNLVIQSSTLPKTNTLMAGLGDVAINLAFLDFEGLETFPQDAEIRYLKVQNIAFVKYENEWIMVLQIARVGFPADQDAGGVYVYQFVSYPSRVAGQMTQSQAVQYVNTILKLAGSR